MYKNIYFYATCVGMLGSYTLCGSNSLASRQEQQALFDKMATGPESRHELTVDSTKSGQGCRMIEDIVGSIKIGEGCRMISAGFPSFFGLELEDGHGPAFWLLL